MYLLMVWSECSGIEIRAHPLEFDRHLFLNNDSPKLLPSSWITEGAPDQRLGQLPVPHCLVLLILSNPVYPLSCS